MRAHLVDQHDIAPAVVERRDQRIGRRAVAVGDGHGVELDEAVDIAPLAIVHAVLIGAAAALRVDIDSAESGALRIGEERRHGGVDPPIRSEEHTSELQSLMRISYAVFCLKKKQNNNNTTTYNHNK